MSLATQTIRLTIGVDAGALRRSSELTANLLAVRDLAARACRRARWANSGLGRHRDLEKCLSLSATIAPTVMTAAGLGILGEIRPRWQTGEGPARGNVPVPFCLGRLSERLVDVRSCICGE